MEETFGAYIPENTYVLPEHCAVEGKVHLRTGHENA
jgi:hypothetical protein